MPAAELPSTPSTESRRAVLITGCSSGIGRAAALGLPTSRYRVFAAVRDPADAASLAKAGLDTLVLDLACSRSIRDAMSRLIESTGGRLYALVNNGAYGQPGAVEDLSREALRSQFETNLFGTHELTRECLTVMRGIGEGRIIQISSILGRICLANRGAYNASKHALEALSDTLRLELDGSGICVSLIEPGPIDSRFRANALAAFDRHVNASDSVHARTYRAVRARLESEARAPFTLPAEAILAPLRHALESHRPRIRYPLTLPSRILPNLKRVLPDRTMDRILRAVGDKPPRS